MGRWFLRATFLALVIVAVIAALAARPERQGASSTSRAPLTLPLLFESAESGDELIGRSRGYIVRVSAAGAQFDLGDARMMLRFERSGGILQPDRRRRRGSMEHMTASTQCSTATIATSSTTSSSRRAHPSTRSGSASRVPTPSNLRTECCTCRLAGMC